MFKYYCNIVILMANVSITFSTKELKMLSEVVIYRSKQEDMLLTRSDILREALELIYDKMQRERKNEPKDR